jgi:Leucine-rich repeat (LRR) protein
MTRILVVLLLSVPVLAADDPTADNLPGGSGLSSSTLSASEIDELVRQLDDARFSQRTRAVRQLTDIGLPALRAVLRATESPSAEAQQRAFIILMEWSRATDDELQSATVAALQNLSSHGSDRTARLALDALHSRRESILESSIQFFESLDARLAVKRTKEGAVDYTTLQITAAWKGNDEDLRRLRDIEQLQWLSVENSNVGNRGMQWIADCRDLRQLYLGQTRITESGLTELRDLTQLRHLSLRFLQVGDGALATLAPMPQLESLGLDGTQVTNEGLSRLKEFPNLKSLWLDATQVTDKGLVHLRTLANLNRLFLSKSSTGGAGLANLAELQQLDYLSLKEVQLTEEGVAQLGKLKSLTTLGLDHTNVTDAMLAHLGGLTNLQVLWLSRTPVTDECFRHLAELPNLRTVIMHGSNATKEGAEAFQKAHGNCRVQL